MEETGDERYAVHQIPPKRNRSRREIIAGPGRREKGETIPMQLKVGDRVIYGKYSGTQVELDNEEIILIKEADVIAKLA
jgi:chaperonin GroES